MNYRYVITYVRREIVDGSMEEVYRLDYAIDEAELDRIGTRMRNDASVVWAHYQDGPDNKNILIK